MPNYLRKSQKSSQRPRFTRALPSFSFPAFPVSPQRGALPKQQAQNHEGSHTKRDHKKGLRPSDPSVRAAPDPLLHGSLAPLRRRASTRPRACARARNNGLGMVGFAKEAFGADPDFKVRMEREKAGEVPGAGAAGSRGEPGGRVLSQSATTGRAKPFGVLLWLGWAPKLLRVKGATLGAFAFCCGRSCIFGILQVVTCAATVRRLICWGGLFGMQVDLVLINSSLSIGGCPWV